MAIMPRFLSSCCSRRIERPPLQVSSAPPSCSSTLQSFCFATSFATSATGAPSAGIILMDTAMPLAVLWNTFSPSEVTTSHPWGSSPAAKAEAETVRASAAAAAAMVFLMISPLSLSVRTAPSGTGQDSSIMDDFRRECRRRILPGRVAVPESKEHLSRAFRHTRSFPPLAERGSRGPCGGPEA